MGRLVDKFGERVMLSASYLGLALVFVGYATLKNVNYLYGLYCIDNFLFVGGIALNNLLKQDHHSQGSEANTCYGGNHEPSRSCYFTFDWWLGMDKVRLPGYLH